MSEVKEQLNNVVQRLNALEKRPSTLIKDAVLADLIKLYDAVLKLPIRTVATPVVTETVVEAQPKRAQTLVLSESIANPEIIIETKTPDAEQQPVAVDEKQAEPIAVEPKMVTKSRPRISVNISEMSPTVKEEATETNTDKNILAGKLNLPPLEDLRSGIPLNEKFGIIQNLFNGNASDFGDAVLKLNNSNSAEEMQHYLNLLKQRLGWNVENESYIAFAGYVERRMMTVAS